MGGEGGFEVVGVNTEGDFEFFGFGTKIGFAEAGADGVSGGGGGECEGNQANGQEEAQRGEHARGPEW